MYFSRALTLLAFALGVAAAPVAEPDVQLEKRGISTSLYNDLVWYFQYAASSYSIVCLWPNGNTLVTGFNDLITDTNGFVARDDNKKEIIVALRGSSSLTDFLTDADLFLTNLQAPGLTAPAGAKVHDGFSNAWNAVASNVISIVKGQLKSYPKYTIVTTGHSLGGALSSLAAVTLKANFPSTPIRMYTYGQPRTGNPIYASYVNSQFGSSAYRVVHTYDGVPTMIPTSLGYHHHGVEYWQNPDPASPSTVKACDPSGEDPTCSDSIPSTGINLAHTSYFGILAITPFCI
ncbi:hypothetical protein JAAARDRAFT_150249 [Jaapia argillacea MUCL 33604]|uniref:Fungal lipase-type domain-containing protein n=1 Tax=Jaapia argillacea MUCL 33604 TaxID=933084 RepID=A0A067QFX9_9AGAM|nr:hypothetical protein JAAARDRAFT_150249 [Jaapia argillacea MUCL 33604]